MGVVAYKYCQTDIIKQSVVVFWQGRLGKTNFMQQINAPSFENQTLNSWKVLADTYF